MGGALTSAIEAQSLNKMSGAPTSAQIAQLSHQTFGAVDISNREATCALTSADGCTTVFNSEITLVKRRGDGAHCNFLSEVVKLMHRGLSARLLESERRHRHSDLNFLMKLVKLTCRGFWQSEPSNSLSPCIRFDNKRYSRESGAPRVALTLD